jgi:hypothetical protein
VVLTDSDLVTASYPITLNLNSVLVAETVAETTETEETQEEEEVQVTADLSEGDSEAYSALMSVEAVDGFDWGAMFAQALLNRGNDEQKEQEIVDPTATLKSISTSGEV